jgi:NIMA (never in mitosis gene a)-related kinase
MVRNGQVYVILLYFEKSNLFLTQNNQKNHISIKIGDLGDSKSIEDYLKTFVGTPFYVSPELTRNQAYTAKTDVW